MELTTVSHPRTFSERALLMLVWLYVPITAALIVAIVVDDRMLLGESVWTKPLKFAVSIGLNGAAFVWLMSRVKPSVLKTIAVASSALGLGAEQVLITIQGSRGVRSHFNMTRRGAANAHPRSGRGVTKYKALLQIAYAALAIGGLGGTWWFNSRAGDVEGGYLQG